MILMPRNLADFQWLREAFMTRGNIGVAESAHILAWATHGQIKWLVAFDGWVGTTCHMHMANIRPGTPFSLEFVRAVFDYAFRKIGRTHVFGLVNTLNPAALRIDRWLGFREVYRVKGANENGGDLVFMEMTPADCRWLEKANEQKLPANA